MKDVVVTHAFLKAADRFSLSDRGRILEFVRKMFENPLRSGIHVEPLHQTSSPDVRSARVSKSIRALLLEKDERYYLLHVDNHDEAYQWVKRRKVSWDGERKSIQIVALIEREETQASKVNSERTSAGLFDDYEDEQLLAQGVPGDWLPIIRTLTDVQQLNELDRTYPEATELWVHLLGLADGRPVLPPRKLKQTTLWSMEDEEPDPLPPSREWLRPLTPGQRDIVLGSFNGPMRVTGGAGTGKTIVAVYRAVHLARNGHRVLLTTYTRSLVRSLRDQVDRLSTAEESQRIEVANVHKVARDIVGETTMSDGKELETRIRFLAAEGGQNPDFALDEWNTVIARMGIFTREEYLNESRTGRKSALRPNERALLWAVFERVYVELERSKRCTWFQLCKLAADRLSRENTSPYTAVLVDELQDLGRQELRMLHALCNNDDSNFMLIGDAGQRIYNQGGVNLRELGIETRGRSKRLLVSYRMSESIRRFAERLLGDARQDPNGEVEQSAASESETSDRLGERPALRGFATHFDQAQFLIQQIRKLQHEGVDLSDVAVFVPKNDYVTFLISELGRERIPCRKLGVGSEGVNIDTMYQAKGWEFRVVFLAYCQQGQLPNYGELLNTLVPEQGAVRERYRRLLYVALTRAREKVFITWVKQPSELLQSVLPPVRTTAATSLNNSAT